MSLKDELTLTNLTDPLDCIYTDKRNPIFVCMICKTVITFNSDKGNIISQINSTTHKNSKIEHQIDNNVNFFQSQQQFDRQFVEAFIISDIPLSKLTNPTLKKFVQTPLSFKTPSINT